MDPSDDDGRRQPNNMRGLLKFCMENTKSEDAQGTTAPMDPEAINHKFANNSFKEMAEKHHILMNPDPQLALINQDKALEGLGLYRFRIPMDGNCLFRAVAVQMKFDQGQYHTQLRQAAVGWMREHCEDLLAGGLLDSLLEIEETAKSNCWPGQASVVALANIFGVNIAVIQGGDQGEIDIQHISPFETPENDEGSIILAYLYKGHYDAVVDQPNIPNPDYDNWLKIKSGEELLDHRMAKQVSQDPPFSNISYQCYDTLNGPLYIEMPAMYESEFVNLPLSSHISDKKEMDTDVKWNNLTELPSIDRAQEELRFPLYGRPQEEIEVIEYPLYPNDNEKPVIDSGKELTDLPLDISKSVHGQYGMKTIDVSCLPGIDTKVDISYDEVCDLIEKQLKKQQLMNQIDNRIQEAKNDLSYVNGNIERRRSSADINVQPYHSSRRYNFNNQGLCDGYPEDNYEIRKLQRRLSNERLRYGDQSPALEARDSPFSDRSSMSDSPQNSITSSKKVKVTPTYGGGKTFKEEYSSSSPHSDSVSPVYGNSIRINIPDRKEFIPIKIHHVQNSQQNPSNSVLTNKNTVASYIPNMNMNEPKNNVSHAPQKRSTSITIPIQVQRSNNENNNVTNNQSVSLSNKVDDLINQARNDAPGNLNTRPTSLHFSGSPATTITHRSIPISMVESGQEYSKDTPRGKKSISDLRKSVFDNFDDIFNFDRLMKPVDQNRNSLKYWNKFFDE